MDMRSFLIGIRAGGHVTLSGGITCEDDGEGNVTISLTPDEAEEEVTDDVEQTDEDA